MQFSPVISEFSKQFDSRKTTAHCICGATRSIPIKWKDRYDIKIMPSFCIACGHIYARFQLQPNDLVDFYSTTYRHLYRRDANKATSSLMLERTQLSKNVILPVFQKLFQNHSQKIVVEWGCSGGWNLFPFAEQGIKTYGFDYDGEYIELGKKEFGLDLKKIEKGEVPTELIRQVDFLILNHVLEHIVDPISFIMQLTPLLKEDGVIFIGLPFIENIWVDGFHNYFHIAHIHYFSIPYIIQLVEQAGFRILNTNEREGWLTIKYLGNNPTQQAVTPDARRYNATRIARFGIPYFLTYWPYRQIIKMIKRVPWLTRYLKRLRSR